MLNPDFWPTPASVAHQMCSMLPAERWAEATVLEPSAGKGDLADAAKAAIYHAQKTGRDTSHRVHCVEIDPELQATLRGKGFSVVGQDFLQFQPDCRYSVILMNPPFAQGAKHLLHAWEILAEGGDILCLLNTATLTTRHTAERRLIEQVIADTAGQVTDLGQCFTNAERRTHVSVSLVYLHKPAVEGSPFGFFAGPDKDPVKDFNDAGGFDSEVATIDLLANLVRDYDACREAFAEATHLLTRIGQLARRLRSEDYERYFAKAFTEASEMLIKAGDATKRQEAYNHFVGGLKREAWRTVFNLTRFRSLCSERVMKEFDKLQENNQDMAFTRQNILALLDMLLQNRGRIGEQCVLDAFDALTRYHKENRVHVEGWLSNDAWKVNNRVVLPCMVDWTWGTPRMNYDKADKMNDLDRAMAYLEGKTLDSVQMTIANAVNEHFNKYERKGNGLDFESTYFWLKAFKKGTLHLTFKDKFLLDHFNTVAARGKNWLPDDYKSRRKEDTARERHADKRGLPLMAGCI